MSRGASVRMRALLALAATGVVLGGCGGGEDPEETAETAASTPTSTSPAAGTASGPGGDQEQVELYFTTGEQFKKVERKLPQRGSGVELATRALLEGPTGREQSGDAEAQTQIPADVSVQQVSVAGDGTAVVEVSEEFLDGVPTSEAARSEAEQAELSARLGQVTYTLTQFDEVESAKVVAGGIAVEAPLERADYRPPAQGPQRRSRPRGAKSPDTRALQKRLAKLRYLNDGAVDGVDGYRTQQAVIAFQSWEGLERDGIVGPATTAALARARPPKPGAGGPSRRIEVHRDKGVALLIEDNETKRAIHVSTGAPGTSTPAGTFAVFRKELRSWSVPFSVWLPYASYFNQGIAFHEYPDVPTYPASHGCVRVPAPEARGVYRFAKLDTVVVVI